MAATERQWTIREDGCLFLDKNLQSVTYHASLNSIILSSNDHSITVLDATSGVVLQKSDLSGKKREALRCLYLAEKDRCVFSDSTAVSVRRDLRGILLLDTALQIPVCRAEDVVKLEIPLAEAVHLFKALVSVELPGNEHAVEVVRELESGIETARQATEGSHKTVKWATVCLQLQHAALKSVCMSLVSEMKRTSQLGPGLPVASAVTDRLSHLLPSHLESGPGPVDRSLMYSEAARRHTFSKWPHMEYKWALPEPMAQAGFYHQPNSTGDDRAMCFTCNVCLVCWEPTDEPWSEHERHSPQCPYIKGEFTQNVPLAVTYATQPAQLHGEAYDKIACISSTANEDFVSTSTRDGSIVIWNISHLLQKQSAFNIDLSDAIVALKTGLQIERSSRPAKQQEGTDIHESSLPVDQEGHIYVTNYKDDQEGVKEILLHKNSDDENEEESNRPSNDLIVSSLSIIDWSSCKDIEHFATSACLSPKATVDVVHPSLVCGLSLRRTKCVHQDDKNSPTSPTLSSSLERRTEVVQLMNKVNEGVRNEDLRIIPECDLQKTEEDFLVPDSALIPHLLVVSFDKVSLTTSHGKGKNKEKSTTSGISFGGSGSGGSKIGTSEGGKMVQMSSFITNDSHWSMLLENDPWLDPDVQIVGFTPSPIQPSHSNTSHTSSFSFPKPVSALQNGPSSLSGPFGGMPEFGSEGSSPQSPCAYLNSEVISEVKKKDPSTHEHYYEEGQKRPGTVLQCVQLPSEFSTEALEIRLIHATVDRRYIIVVIAPRNEYISVDAAGILSLNSPSLKVKHLNGAISSLPHENGVTTDDAETLEMKQPVASSKFDRKSDTFSTGFGGVLVYKIKVSNNRTVLEDTPCVVHRVSKLEHAILDIFVLPPEVVEQMEEEETSQQGLISSRIFPNVVCNGTGSLNGLGAVGQVILILGNGSLQILNLADARVISQLMPENGDRFTSATYCTGIERLCVCTSNGALKFYQVTQQGLETSNSNPQKTESAPKSPLPIELQEGKKTSVEEDNTDAAQGKSAGVDYLANGLITPESLVALHSLTEFENLMPRFTATVPPCWSEIQQEQQQRRHPQHLQQQGEATQHTRTWKLTQNGSTWDDHLFEIVLPRPCSVGHVDIKFTLHPMCTTTPNIEATLLKQNIGNMRRQMQTSLGVRYKKPGVEGDSNVGSNDKENENYVQDPAFLEKNNAEILCGPIKLNSCLDLSGCGGLASLSSPKLLNCKPRSLLLHLKGFKNKTEDSTDSGGKNASTSSSDEKTEKAPEVKKKTHFEYKNIKCLFENIPNTGAGASAVERLAATAPKQKLTDVKGCDWLAEISLTVRKFKRTSILRERQQRNAMLETTSFHQKLLQAVTSTPTDLQGMNAEYYQNLALDVLLWIGAMQMNDPNKRSGSRCLVTTVQTYLPDLIKTCFIDGLRTTAHKCARLLALCIEYAKLSDDQDLAPTFSFQLLQAQLGCLPLLVCCSSAGAMKWFFTILNRVKCMETSLVASSVTDLLKTVAAHYHQDSNPLHALLKTRYGLYGHPFDVDLFDMELPHNLRQGPTPPSTYAAVTSKGTSTFGGPSMTTGTSMSVPSTSGGIINSGQNKEEPDLYEMLTSSMDKTSRSQGDLLRTHILGLLEVEPLPFTCHATSDGTRVERMDAASSAPTATTGSSLTASTVPLSMGGISFDDPTPPGLFANSMGSSMGAVGGISVQGSGMSGLAVADSLKKALQTYVSKQPLAGNKLHQLLSNAVVQVLPLGISKSSPAFMTPCVTPPNEGWQGAALKEPQQQPPPLPPPPPPLPPSEPSPQQLKPPLPLPTVMVPTYTTTPAFTTMSAPQQGFTHIQTGQSLQQQVNVQKSSPCPQPHTLLQAPPDQVLVIERMHSGARRFVTLDFGKPIVLTDIVIPACGDLASLSIDVWVQGEEVDGQRIVVAADIGTRTLVMNNIMPAPICRYLKITTVGRYGAGTTRSRIPLGSFYGHSYILPWEWQEYEDVHSFSPIPSISVAQSPLSSPQHCSPAAAIGVSTVKQLESVNQSTLVTHLSVFLSLQEDLQCRYSLACTRLSGLLASVTDAQFVTSHVRYYLKRGQRRTEDDAAILQSYTECLQLQLQLNLAQRAITRLQRAIGMKCSTYEETGSFNIHLQQSSTDKLRVILEGLLDTLLGLTVPSPSVPQPPHALYLALTPSTAEALFHHLCLLGSRRIQVSTGLLLSRVCGSQPWWGVFLGHILQEFFHSEYTQVFPQDRVFVLVSALGQKALTGPSCVYILDSLLAMLTNVLQPIVAIQNAPIDATECLDLGLVSWILLFLCRNFDTALGCGLSDEGEKMARRERDALGSGRWNFIQGSWKVSGSSGSKSRSRKVYSRSMQKRILHHKQRLHDIESAKAMVEKAKDKLSSQVKGMLGKETGATKEGKAFLKEQESLIRKELAQFRSKHFKDMIYMRRNDLEILRRLPKEDGGGGKETDDEAAESQLVLPRDRCLQVVRGLMSLLLSMDFSCHVDLFLVACKVLAKICVATRPALNLAEVMSREQLEWLVLLAVHHEHSQGPMLWGGPWASHAITCLLQDILEGEHLYPNSMTSSDEDLLGSENGEGEIHLTPSSTSITLEENTDDDLDALTDGGAEGGLDTANLDKDTSLMMDLLLEDVEMEDDSIDSLISMDTPVTTSSSTSVASKLFSPSMHPAFSSLSPKSVSVLKKKMPVPISQQNGQLEDVSIPTSVFKMNAIADPSFGTSSDKKTGKLKMMKTKLNDLVATKSGASSHGLSVAQDARLEFGLQGLPELRLRVMLSVHMDSLLGAFASPLPVPPQLPHSLNESSFRTVSAPTDDELSQASQQGHTVSKNMEDISCIRNEEQFAKIFAFAFHSLKLLSSMVMLSRCFEHLFAQMIYGRISLDTVLQLWLTLNQNAMSSSSPHDDSTPQAFNPARIPIVPLSARAVAHLMEAVVSAPVVSVRSWVFVLHTLCLLTNQRVDAVATLEEEDAGGVVGGQDPEGGFCASMASVVLTDQNLTRLIIKFLSGSSVSSSASNGVQFFQMGPTATKAFDDFLNRLLCKSVDISGQNLKELFLKIVFQLSAERGAICSSTGPLDAQCKFVETVSSIAFETVDLSNAVSVVAAISSLVYQHILCQDPVMCSSSHDSVISARSCFSGLFASLLRGGDSRGAGGEASRDQLMCSLLRLVNKLVQVTLPGAFVGSGSAVGNMGRTANSNRVQDDMGLQEGMSDAVKLTRAFPPLPSSLISPLPRSLMSDDEKRQQTNSNSSSNGTEQGHSTDAASNERRQTIDRYVADIILGNPIIMQNLVQALSYCSSNKMALILGSAPVPPSSGFNSANENFNMADPLSVGDGIYQILCTLLVLATNPDAMTDSLLHYMAAGCQLTPGSICRLSEPLLKFLLRVLDSGAAIRHFVQRGGVQVVCNNLVRSSQQFISVGPSMISTIMQNMSSLSASSAEEKAKAADADNIEGLYNFAPLGTIIATSPTASPADALIQTSAPHRRARTAAWSYHFYPDEPWVELIITLPFAVLLRQVQIRPHGGALTTCPSFVSLEISHDCQTVIPTSPPLMTCSLGIIKLQLLRPEVVSSVTLRLHRPRDSMTIGLQQICLQGQRAFGEIGEGASAFLPFEDAMATCSMGWMRLLHHCLMSPKEVQIDVTRAAASIRNLLNTAVCLLVSPTASHYAAKIETVLLRLGLSSLDMGLAVIENILRNPAQCSDRGGGHVFLGRVNGIATPYTMEIIYQLGITQDLGTKQRVHAFLQWLADSSQAYIQRLSSVHETRLGSSIPEPASPISVNPAPEHVHCVAAILWYSQELPVTYNLLELITPNLVHCLYQWASLLPPDCLLKKSINHVLCSASHIHPPYFSQILHWAGFAGASSSASGATDDSKDSAVWQQQQQEENVGPGPLTDDSKEASLQPSYSITRGQQNGLDRGTMTDDSKEAKRLSQSQQSLSKMVLDKGHLASIAVVCRSPAAVTQLLESGLPTILSQGLAEFCSQQIVLTAERNLATEVRRSQQQQESTDNGPRKGEGLSCGHVNSRLTAELVSAILSFFAELCCEPSIKDWMGSAEGNIFWPSLLTLLCNASPQRTVFPVPSPATRQKVMNSDEQSQVETAAIHFFTQVISCHSVNQLFFSKVLCDVIRQQGITRAGSLLGTVPLSGFTRRILLQVLLEDEKVTVALRALPELYCRFNPVGMSSRVGRRVHHPRFGAGRGCCSLTTNINSPCSEVLMRFGDPSTASIVPSSLTENSDDNKRAEDLSKESNDLGIEVMEYINAAGVHAKEKREKSPSPSKAGLPPRPPTRRGHHPPDLGSSSLKFPMCTLHLQHVLLKNRALPGDLTFSQLMQILLHRGLAPGTTTLCCNITINTRPCVPHSMLPMVRATSQQDAYGSLEEWGDYPEDIPDEVLLASSAFPSALHVFASVGGLALLAEHLPLLYPDLTRQGMTADVSSTDNTIPDIGQDWVTVESSDELYDPYMEPVSPAPNSSQAARHVAGAMPTIPPHSLIAFGLFLRLPGYAEVLLKERKKAQCLLRLVLGVTDDGDGGHILTSPIAGSLPTLPFTVLKSLFDSSPLTTDDGVLLRRMALDIGVLHLVLACLSVLSHHGPRVPMSGFQHETQVILTAMQTAVTQGGMSQTEEKTQHYWAKGTGFGTGSTTSSWDAEQALLRQRSEEEHVAGLLQVLGSYINPGGYIPKDYAAEEEADLDIRKEAPGTSSGYSTPSEKWPLPEVVLELLSQSCLIPAISSYLRNDSVLDMARHVPLYRALLQLIRGLAVCPTLVPLLLPMSTPPSQPVIADGIGTTGESSDTSSVSIEKLLSKMKGCVDTYASRLKSNKGKVGISTKAEEEENEGLALLIPDIQDTARIVRLATQRVKDAEDHGERTGDFDANAWAASKTNEERYLDIMRPLQFDTYELVTEEGRGLKFNIPHHFESNVKASGAFNNPARTRRLAQEAVTLSTSLPLSYNSSVFVRCDEERLDIMKVLITGPSDTPYANGAFEFDVYFPQDYPNSPPYINLETTGNHTVRFNPNLYNDGKVCLSILNTWHGRPEEKWNAQTSSFLQVLVSIQSLILVAEPYFNEPGYERSRGTPSGTASSREYDANIRQATVKWAMLEQLKNVSPCFKEVIHNHFWLKRHEVLKQCEDWIAEMELFSTDKRTGRSIAHSTLALKRHYNQLREELSKLKPPAELEACSDLDSIDPKGKQYSTDVPQASTVVPSSSVLLPKPVSVLASPTTNMSTSGLGPYMGSNGLFLSNPEEQELPDV